MTTDTEISQMMLTVSEVLICLLYFFFPGESGLGKSTLINSLFLTDLYSPEFPGPSHRIKKTVQVRMGEEEQQQGLH